MSRIIGGNVFLSVKETANKLGVNPNTIRNYVKRSAEQENKKRKIPYIKDPITGRMLFLERTINNIVKKFSDAAKT